MAKAEQATSAARPLHSSATKEGLTVKIYRGDGSAMLAFDLDKAKTANFAGFAIKRTSPNGKSQYLPNLRTGTIPKFSVCFSPHKEATTSLQRVAEAIQKAESSVLFAVMELSGGGPVLDDLKALPAKKNIFSYGMTQTASGIKIYKPGASEAIVVPFEYLKGKVPPPFHDEYSGGAGIVIHDKFVVVDFNGENPGDCLKSLQNFCL